MIKTKLINALARSLDRIRHEDDKLPISMRGELEVIVKDREGNVLSYERGHNQVTDLAKMEIIHLLAGEIFTEDAPIYSVAASSDSDYKLFSSTGTVKVKQTVTSDSTTPVNVHSTTLNSDGTLVSGQQYFFDGRYLIPSGTTGIFLNQYNDINNAHTYSSPMKMLFGTGMEAHATGDIANVYSDKDGAAVSNNLINKVNGFSADGTLNTAFMTNLRENQTYNPPFLTNYYSGDSFRSRTLQPTTTTPLTEQITSAHSAIDGAIKNCYITSTSDSAKYDAGSRMATGVYRGFGYPSFIYAQRKTDSFYDPTSDEYVHYNLDTDISSKYETELVYVVNMPTQPVNVEDISSFYPYNGWILKQAGLFSDSRYMLRSRGDTVTLYDGITGANIASGNNPYYVNSAAGTLLFKRNLSSPILKTPDISITFAWHVYIVTN